MKKILAILLIAFTVSTAKANESRTPDALVETFIQVVNARDKKLQRHIVHPGCTQGLSPLEERYLSDVLQRDFRRQIPEKRQVKITELEEGPLPFEGMMIWKVKPTHEFEIEFSIGEYSSTSIIRYIAKGGDNWYIVEAFPNAENMKLYEKKIKSQPADAPAKK
jgi:hypothetical protein